MTDSTFTLETKVAIVVGAANGIGRATARAFAAADAAVTCADVEEAGAKTTAAEIERDGAQALPIHLDVTEGASCRATVAATVERFGGLGGTWREARAMMGPKHLLGRLGRPDEIARDPGRREGARERDGDTPSRGCRVDRAELGVGASGRATR